MSDMMEAARHALRAYGYADEGGRWYSRRKHNTTQSWEEVPGGFLRWDPDNGAWQAVPYRLRPEFENTGGLDFHNSAHQPCFEWVWPIEHVEREYRMAWDAMKAHAEAFEADKAVRVGSATLILDAPHVETVAGVAEEPPAPPHASAPEKPRSFLDRLLGS